MYHNQFWSPQDKIDIMEEVQSKATKRVKSKEVERNKVVQN